MRRGDYAAAWAVNDAVLAGRTSPPDDPRLPYHLRHVWDGRPFDGRDVLVRCYHGLGDTLQFLRYLPALRARAAFVALEAQPELVPLLRGMPGVDRLIPFDVAAPASPAGCDIESMELFHALRLAPGFITISYLPFSHAAPSPAALPRDDLSRNAGEVKPMHAPGPLHLSRSSRERSPRASAAGEGLSIGLCAKAGDWDSERSIPLPQLAAALPAHARPVRLQRADADALDWANPGATLVDIMETATLVRAVDLVVTVDTMIAHLAGTLGRPVCLLLKKRADWRWMDQGQGSPWYPSMRLYRQHRVGDWSAPLRELARDLSRLSPPACARAG